VASLVVELAEYERAPAGAVRTTPEAIRRALEAVEGPRLHALIAEDDAGAPVGCALYYRAFSSWRATWGFYLEDLFVRPAARGQGHGVALLRAVAAEAVNAGADRMDWVVLDWNAPALDFYRRVGATEMSEWRLMRLQGEALREMGS